jgi:hypothetical protein
MSTTKGLALLIVLWTALAASPALAQEEVASPLSRYGRGEVAGVADVDEVRPGLAPSRLSSGIGPSSRLMPGAEEARGAWNRGHLADAHQGVPFADQRPCRTCHSGAVRNLHSARAGVTCVQCHGGGTVASINQAFSRMNPVRRHAYVCGKCHTGATLALASYVVHEPNPLSSKASVQFPALAWAVRIMLAVAVLTFVLFLPHTILWGVREYRGRSRKEGAE